MATPTNKPTYIYHYREIPQWLKQSPNTFHLLAEFARRARREEADVGWNGENIRLQPRQFITGRIRLSQELGLTQGEYRSSYQKLVLSGLIRTIRSTKRYTIAEFLADDVFGLNLPSDLPSGQPSELPTDNQPTTTNKNGNNEKNFNSRLEKPTEELQKSPSYKNSEAYKRLVERRKELGLWPKKL